MECIVLAGGFAERLWPLTRTFPKVLLEIAGKPILSHILEKLVSSSFIKNIYVSVDEDKFEIFKLSFENYNITYW